VVPLRWWDIPDGIAAGLTDKVCTTRAPYTVRGRCVIDVAPKVRPMQAIKALQEVVSDYFPIFEELASFLQLW